MQRRIVFTLVSLVLLFSLIACSKQNQEQHAKDRSEKEMIVEKQEGDFELKLISKKRTYAANEKINIFIKVSILKSVLDC